MVHTGKSEFASNLKAELLAVAFDLQHRNINEDQAKRKLAVIRRRRVMGEMELQRSMRPPAQQQGAHHAAV